MELKFYNLFFVDKNIFPEERQQRYEEHHQKVNWVYYCTIVLGLWLAIAPLFFAAPWAVVWNGIIAGVMLVLLSFPKGNIEGSRGDFDTYVI